MSDASTATTVSALECSVMSAVTPDNESTPDETEMKRAQRASPLSTATPVFAPLAFQAKSTPIKVVLTFS
jgi:hypothetical protein